MQGVNICLVNTKVFTSLTLFFFNCYYFKIFDIHISKRYPKVLVTLQEPETGRKEMFYLMMHSTLYLRLYGVGHMVKDHSDSKRENPLPPHGLLFLISSKGSFIYIILQTG